MNPTRHMTDGHGHSYVETSPAWKEMCVDLPCFRGVWWPDYATTIVEDTINGEQVVIQLWKGWCEQLLMSADMPGGVGAEVGVYRRIPGKPIPEKHGLTGLLEKIKRKLEGITENDLWWPYPELGATITFELVNPTTGKTAFSAGPERTYWLNKWMNLDSYHRFKAQPGVDAPTLAWDYHLRYTINGKSYPVWTGHE